MCVRACICTWRYMYKTVHRIYAWKIFLYAFEYKTCDKSFLLKMSISTYSISFRSFNIHIQHTYISYTVVEWEGNMKRVKKKWHKQTKKYTHNFSLTNPCFVAAAAAADIVIVVAIIFKYHIFYLLKNWLLKLHFQI